MAEHTAVPADSVEPVRRYIALFPVRVVRGNRFVDLVRVQRQVKVLFRNDGSTTSTMQHHQTTPDYQAIVSQHHAHFIRLIPEPSVNGLSIFFDFLNPRSPFT